MRQFNFNLELDFEIQCFKSSEEKLDFLRKKYLEIKDNYKSKEYEAIKIYLQGQILDKIKGESSFMNSRQNPSYLRWIETNLGVKERTQEDHRRFYHYIHDNFGSPEIFSQNPNLSISPFYKLAARKYRDTKTLHEEVVYLIENNPNIQSKDLEDLLEKWKKAQKQINQLNTEVEQLDNERYHDPTNSEQAENRFFRSIAQRRGQPKFREALLKAYEDRCAITGCDAQEALEAAHIIPYCETENNHLSNGLLLRADLHTLFDLNLIVIDPYEDPDKRKVRIDPSLRNTQYGQLEGTRLRKPKDEADLPKKEFLEERCKPCWWYRLPPDLS